MLLNAHIVGESQNCSMFLHVQLEYLNTGVYTSYLKYEIILEEFQIAQHLKHGFKCKIVLS